MRVLGRDLVQRKPVGRDEVQKLTLDVQVAADHHRQRIFRHKVVCQFHLGCFDAETSCWGLLGRHSTWLRQVERAPSTGELGFADCREWRGPNIGH
jgi:hypothetical protein